MQLNDCINFILTKAQNTVFGYFKEKLAKYGVTPVQYALLKCLWDSGDQSPTQLSASLSLDSSTVTGIIDRMEKKDLIRRVQSDTDRRAILISLLPAGKALQKDVEHTISETNEEIMNGINKKDVATFLDVMGKIEKAVENLENGFLPEKNIV